MIGGLAGDDFFKDPLGRANPGNKGGGPAAFGGIGIVPTAGGMQGQRGGSGGTSDAEAVAQKRFANAKAISSKDFEGNNGESDYDRQVVRLCMTGRLAASSMQHAASCCQSFLAPLPHLLFSCHFHPPLPEWILPSWQTTTGSRDCPSFLGQPPSAVTRTLTAEGAAAAAAAAVLAAAAASRRAGAVGTWTLRPLSWSAGCHTMWVAGLGAAGHCAGMSAHVNKSRVQEKGYFHGVSASGGTSCRHGCTHKQTNWVEVHPQEACLLMQSLHELADTVSACW